MNHNPSPLPLPVPESIFSEQSGQPLPQPIPDSRKVVPLRRKQISYLEDLLGDG
ncbi:MAG: hypothetical protein ICV77_16990 [Cyanobacteria bacterium Co-bin8]|nr:hypothetical protein [Cyanobacteria bacterium Co-bin8]